MLGNKLTFAAVAVTLSLAAAPAFAEMGKSAEGSGEISRGASIELSPDAKPIAVPKVDEAASRAAPVLDPNKAIQGMTSVTRSADGNIVKTPASPALQELIKKDFGVPVEKPKEGPNRKRADEAFGTDRQVFGQDDRIQITGTKQFPFRAIGYIEGKAKGGTGTCSGTLIGPRTVLTAAHCIYSYEDKDWLKEVLFAPGLNGMEDIPFGAWKAESQTILEGFITNDQGFYGSVVPWDLGIITLEQPIGDKLGYFGFGDYDLGDFAANIVGYPGDKPQGTMWRATCDVVIENIGYEYFQYDCDTYPGSSGSSVYAFDNAKKRVVTGVNVAENPKANTAVRLNASYVEWIKSNWK